MIVVDNSVISGFGFPADAYHNEAERAFTRDPNWQAPVLYRSEMRSVAAGHLRRGELEETVLGCRRRVDVLVAVHELTDAEVFAVLSASPLSAYDAEYVALAQRLGCRLVTTDQDMLKHFPKIAVRLADFAAGR